MRHTEVLTLSETEQTELKRTTTPAGAGDSTLRNDESEVMTVKGYREEQVVVCVPDLRA